MDWLLYVPDPLTTFMLFLAVGLATGFAIPHRYYAPVLIVAAILYATAAQPVLTHTPATWMHLAALYVATVLFGNGLGAYAKSLHEETREVKALMYELRVQLAALRERDERK